VIRTVENPIYAEGALAVLKGNLAPDGCVIKPSACESRFLKHTGPALVFDDYPGDEEGDRRSRSRCVTRSRADPAQCRAAGRAGHAGMGHAADPTKLVKQGVRDMVRLSDARMSGTSYGACILHVAPESFVGGPLALVQERRPHHARCRRAQPSISMCPRPSSQTPRRMEAAGAAASERGYGWMFSKHIKQANEGCDFDFWRAGFGKPREPSNLLTPVIPGRRSESRIHNTIGV
jgi:dihydroxy-acid dehydratase